jgi:group I intron endonuclease
MLVYLITNKINDKKYVGQTIRTLEERWKDHKKLSRNKDKVSPHLHNAIFKYGPDNFKVQTLIIVGSKQEMDYYERALIKVWNLTDEDKGYNITAGGDGVSRPCSAETKKKISDALKKRSADGIPSHNLGLKRTDETKRKLSESHKGKKLSAESEKKRLETMRSPEYREKQSKLKMGNKNRLGAVLSEETKRKISESIRKHYNKENEHTSG